MQRVSEFKGWLAAAVLICLSVATVFAAENGRRSSRTAFAHALPAMDGQKLGVDLVEVTYGPGAASPTHSHPCPVIGYVVSGAIRTQVKGEAEAIYKAGESFYEPPNGVHLVSGNASDKQPAKLLAIFICDHEAPLSAPAKGDAK